MYNIFAIILKIIMNNKAQLKLIGKQVRQKRLHLNMTMDVCAEKAGITRTTLSSIEKGTSNCSITALLNVFAVLNLSFNIENEYSSSRLRATRTNSILDKKINDYLIMIIEEYAEYINQTSSTTYRMLKESGVINELKNEYDDLHGYSQEYINEYISSLLIKE